MNIFISDDNPIVAAQNLDDKRVVKMILESAQMLGSALHLCGASHLAKYKKTHINHPSNIWVRQTVGNYNWLLVHFEALCDEYEFRYGKIHASRSMLADLKEGAKYLPTGTLTPFANCAKRSDMNIDYSGINDIPVAYQAYLKDRWKNDKLKPKWTARGEPSFLKDLYADTNSSAT